MTLDATWLHMAWLTVTVCLWCQLALAFVWLSLVLLCGLLTLFYCLKAECLKMTLYFLYSQKRFIAIFTLITLKTYTFEI